MTDEDRTPRNHRKRDILEQLDATDGLTSRQIADESGIEGSSARSVLARLKRQGCVETEGGGFSPGRGTQTATYHITSRGESKLDHYREEGIGGPE